MKRSASNLGCHDIAGRLRLVSFGDIREAHYADRAASRREPPPRCDQLLRSALALQVRLDRPDHSPPPRQCRRQESIDTRLAYPAVRGIGGRQVSPVPGAAAAILSRS